MIEQCFVLSLREGVTDYVVFIEGLVVVLRQNLPAYLVVWINNDIGGEMSRLCPNRQEGMHAFKL